jgi:transcriptional regulator with XRE-family HTH domain
LVRVIERQPLPFPSAERRIGLHISQIRRYEAGDSEPTLDVIRKLAIALSVSADVLVFEEGERGPDEDLRLATPSRSHGDAVTVGYMEIAT